MLLLCGCSVWKSVVQKRSQGNYNDKTNPEAFSAANASLLRHLQVLSRMIM